MAVTVERLIATLEARFDKYEKDLNRVLGTTNRTFARIEGRGKQLEARMASMGGSIGRRFAAALAAGLTVDGFRRLSDAATRIDNALKVAGLSGAELEKVYGKLRDSAIRNSAPIEAMVTLYSRLAQSQDALKVSQDEMTNFTDKIGVALRVSGATATEASGALLQLSQALAAGTVRAEEFNSINEGAQPILQAVAAGLKEAGGDVGKLRQLVVDGKVSSEAFFRAFEAGAPMLEQKVAGATITIGGALSNLNTALVDSVKEFNLATKAGERLAGGIDTVARAIADFDVAGFISKVSAARSEFEGFLASIGNSSIFERLAEFATGRELTVGQPINLETSEAESELAALERQIEILRQRIEANKEMAIDTSGAQAQLATLLQQANALRVALSGVNAGLGSDYKRGTPGDPNALAQQGGGAVQRGAPVVLKPISINDAPASGGKGGGGGGRKGRGGGGDEDEFQRETQQIRERTEALAAETAALAGINPLIEDYDFALTKARAAQDLLTAAKRAGIAITPELKAQIDALATGYANATVEANRLEESQDKVRQRADDMRSLGKDALGGFIRDLREGKSASEALAGALDQITDKLLDIALNSLFSGGGLLGGIGGAGLFGGAIIPGILHSGGTAGKDGYGHGRSVPASTFHGAPRYHRGTLAAGEVPAILRRGEIVDPGDGSVFRKAFGGGRQEITLRVIGEEGPMFRPTIQAEAKGVSVQVVRQYDKSLPGRVGDIMERAG